MTPQTCADELQKWAYEHDAPFTTAEAKRALPHRRPATISDAIAQLRFNRGREFYLDVVGYSKSSNVYLLRRKG